MFRSSILRATSRISSRSAVGLSLGKQLYPLHQNGLRLNTLRQANAVRFKSTDTVSDQISEIQTQLPSMDELTNSASDIVGETTQNVGELSNHIGYLDSLGLAQTWVWPADIIQHALEYVHVYTGLPWWGTICSVTVIVRLLMFPLYVKSSDTVARNSRIKPEMDAINKQLMNTTDLAEGQKIAMKRRKLLAENGVKNRWLVAPMIQLPIAIGFFNALRAMGHIPVDGFTNQGIAWFTNLAQADPYLGLQFITAGVLMSFSRLGGETGAQQFSSPMKRFFIILPLLSIPATMKLSAGVVLYFAVNGTFSVIQTTILRNKWIRKKLKIADVVYHKPPPGEENKGILASIKENMNNAKERTEKKRIMQEEEEKLHNLIKEKKSNKRIKIVHKADLK